MHLRMDGHAGWGPQGADLVCAGASTLAYTLAEAVERLYRQRMLRRCPRIEISQGSAEIIAVPKAEFMQEVLLTFWVVEAGIYALGQSFPGSIKMEETLRVKGA